MTSTTTLLISLVAVALGLLLGLWLGRRKKISMTQGKRLEEYDFYPFSTNEAGQVEFNPGLFNTAVQHFLLNRNELAAQQLIIIGEQNLVRDTLTSQPLSSYKTFYQRYDGQSVISDNDHYLENYKRLVQQFGRSFAGIGIEILLHNLVNPARSVIAIENGEVTGRRIESGTTNLVLDLKTRRLHNQDKLNYGLSIGSRKFKCTTIPIFRRDYGLVGAVCINVDVNYLQEEVLSNHQKMVSFMQKLCKTEFELDENILSKSEFQKALKGKRHFRDDKSNTSRPGQSRQLLAIMFSDIVGFSKIMGSDEQRALQMIELNKSKHLKSIHDHHGVLLKEMGDGILASFQSAFHAAACARSLLAGESDGYKLRIGIHLGEVVRAGADVFGDGVNIASRIHELSAPGTLCVSSEVYNNIRNKMELHVEEIGVQTLKNIDQNVSLYQIAFPVQNIS